MSTNFENQNVEDVPDGQSNSMPGGKRRRLSRNNGAAYQQMTQRVTGDDDVSRLDVAAFNSSI